MKRARTRSLAAAVALLALAPPSFAQEPPAKPSDPEEARRRARGHLEQGQQFYDEEAFEAARAEFVRAYELTKSYKVLYNLALVTAQLNDFAGAYRHYERYLKEGGDEIPAARKDEVAASMERLRRRTALVEVVPDPKDAEITIDDKPIGKAPLAAPYMLNPGEHKVGAIAPGHRPAYQHVTLTAGEATRVVLRLPKESVERTIVVEKVAPPRKAVWAYWVPAAVLAAGTVTFAVLTLNEEKELEELRGAPARATDPGAIDEQASRTKTMALVTDVLGAASVVGIGAGLYFTLSASRAEKVAAAPPPVRVRIGPGSFGLRGSF